MADQSKLPVRVITPHEGTEAFTYALKSLRNDVDKSMSLAWRFFVRDTKAVYRESILGYVWLFLPPLATVVVWVFLNSQNLITADSGDVPYPVFVLTGTVLWAAFNTSVMSMQGIVGQARGMISKVNFPHEALILAAFYKSLLDSVIPTFILVPALLIYDVTVGVNTLFFPVGLLILILLGCSLGLIFVPIGALFGDVGRAIQLALRFGFFVTPVIYALPPDGVTRTLLLWNPVTTPLVSSRSFLLGGESVLIEGMIFVGVLSLVALVFSTVAYKVVMPHIIERLNS